MAQLTKNKSDNMNTINGIRGQKIKDAKQHMTAQHVINKEVDNLL